MRADIKKRSRKTPLFVFYTETVSLFHDKFRSADAVSCCHAHKIHSCLQTICRHSGSSVDLSLRCHSTTESENLHSSLAVGLYSHSLASLYRVRIYAHALSSLDAGNAAATC